MNFLRWLATASIILYSTLSFSQVGSLWPTSKTEIVNHTFFKLEYSEEHEQAVWVFYQESASNVNGPGERKNNFTSDGKILTRSALPTDYKGSGYDRGHLCPAGSMKSSQTAMDKTFLMSNMSPQAPGLNRGKWKSLESHLRSYALSNGPVWVTTGPIFEDNIARIGASQVTVPGYFYKVVYTPKGDGKMIGFIFPNQKIEGELSSLIVPVDEIEARVHRDFFSSLQDDQEELLESKKGDWSSWSIETTEQNRLPSGQSIQCNGIAKSTGARCRIKTLNSNGFCHHHQTQVGGASIQHNKVPSTSSKGRCIATTKAGTRCKRQAQSGRSYCWQH